MIINTISQPDTQLGNEISSLLNEEVIYSRIVFVSAFVALRTILRLRERLLSHLEAGTHLSLTVGIDLGGTSREALEELLHWNCETFIFHNAIARATFHPKIYLFETNSSSTIFIGSNNLTDGGFYTNYEAATCYHFDLPEDSAQYENILGTLHQFLNPQGEIVRRLDQELIQRLVARGELPSESEARRNRRNRTQIHSRDEDIPANPFGAVAVPFPPLLPDQLRIQESNEETVGVESQSPEQNHPPQTLDRQYRNQGGLRRVLVWRKVLPASDALQVRDGTAHVGGVRLTQAQFENPRGHRIDQTSYFRQLFADYQWERESGRHRSIDQEHTFVPMHIVIMGTDYGVNNFEISHKPSGEADQNNYTTILRWGHQFNPIVSKTDLTGAVFSLYETDEEAAAFLIDITQSG
jgi:hypothetical protein